MTMVIEARHLCGVDPHTWWVKHVDDPRFWRNLWLKPNESGETIKHSIGCSNHVHIQLKFLLLVIYMYIYMIYIYTHILYMICILGCEIICKRTWMAVPSFSSHDARDRWFKVGFARLSQICQGWPNIFQHFWEDTSGWYINHYNIYIYIYIETWYNQDPIFGIMPCLFIRVFLPNFVYS